MAFCNQCGAAMPDGARFCGSCGAPAAPDAVQAEPARDDGARAAPSPASSSPSAAPPSPTFPPRNGPVGPGSGGAGGAVLPIMFVIALLVIAYLLFSGRNPVTTNSAGKAAQAAAASDTPSARDEAKPTTPRRAVDEASDAATLASANTTATTSAATLDSEFFNDPRGAELRYPGRVRVSGVIASMVMPGRTPALSMEGRNRFNYMIVNFPEGYREQLAPLSKGRFITVSCDSVQGLAGTTILSGCLLV